MATALPAPRGGMGLHTLPPRQLVAQGLRLNKYIKQQPFPKQMAFMLLPQREAFYGGSGGPGKSSALLMCGLQDVHVPNYSALILRRTYADLALPGALMDRAHDWLDSTDAHWNGQEHAWEFPSSAKLTFGYLESERDKFRYRSAEFQYIAFDELTQFSESQYTFLFSRLRRLLNHPVPLRVRSASNPGDIGHAWCKHRFLVDGPTYGRPFVPAKMVDNPYLDVVAYRESLSHLDHVTRLQIEEGDWDVTPEGKMFQRQWFTPFVQNWPRMGRVIRVWDFASTEPSKTKASDPDYLAGGKYTERDGQYWVIDMKRDRLNPLGVEQLIRQTAQEDGRDVEIWIEQEPGASSKIVISDYQRRVLQGYSVHALHVDKAKATRAKPASSAAEAGNIHIVEGPWVTEFLNELALFPGGPHDDMVDTLSGAINIFSPVGKRVRVWGS